MTDIRVSALECVRGIRNGDISAEDFTACTLERISRVDADLNAFITVFDDAVDQARMIDKKVSAGQDPGMCCGMPVSIKDNICVMDKKTTCASQMLKEFVSPYDATAVSRLKDVGAILVGKTNLDEFAMGISTEFSAFGPTRNPWNPQYIPGGSSGGSAASVASFECAASLGSDTGGSVRNPASFCSVVGFKPTYGSISRFGLVSYANSIEQIGPLARTVSDVALVLDAIAGADMHDTTTLDTDMGSCLDGIDAGVDGRKIGIMGLGAGTDRQVESAANDAVSNLEGLGAECEPVLLNMGGYSVAAYYTITSAEAGSNLARYDNIRYGYDFQPEGHEFNSYISQARKRFGPEVTRRMLLGGFVPSAGHAGRYFLKALKVKAALTREVAGLFKEYDFILSPTVPVIPFKIGKEPDDPLARYRMDANTVLANLTGRPAVSVPFAISDGLPIGMQIMADSTKDRILLQAAHALEQTTRLPEVPI